MKRVVLVGIGMDRNGIDAMLATDISRTRPRDPWIGDASHQNG